MSTCTSCGAEVRWHKTPAGKNIPLDPPIVAPGTRGAIACSDGPRISHWATCPTANQHRTKPPTRQHWLTRPWVGFDLETTGVIATEDRIVTAAIRFWPNGIDTTDTDEQLTRTWLADPGIPIPDEASQIHGISTEHAQAHGQPAPIVCAEVGEAIKTAWLAGAVLVVMNGSYDLTMLHAEIYRHHGKHLQTGPVLDARHLDKSQDKYRKGSRKLTDLATHYDVDAGQAHDAAGDVLTAMRVTAAILRKYPRLQRLTLAELWDLQATSHAETDAYFAAKENRAPDGRWPIAPAMANA